MKVPPSALKNSIQVQSFLPTAMDVNNPRCTTSCAWYWPSQAHEIPALCHAHQGPGGHQLHCVCTMSADLHRPDISSNWHLLQGNPIADARAIGGALGRVVNEAGIAILDAITHTQPPPADNYIALSAPQLASKASPARAVAQAFAPASAP